MGRDPRRRPVAAFEARAPLEAGRAGGARAIYRGWAPSQCGGGVTMPGYLLAIDQGTTSTRSILFDAALAPVAVAQREFTQFYPAPGQGEHDPEEIWATTIATAREAMAK